jgi:hypothetical protein
MANKNPKSLAEILENFSLMVMFPEGSDRRPEAERNIREDWGLGVISKALPRWL